MPDNDSFPASIMEHEGVFLAVFPIAEFDEASQEPVLTGSYRAFICRRKFESKGPPGSGLPPKTESYDQYWTLVPFMDVDLRPLQFETAKQAFAKAIELADWFRGKV